MTGTQEFVFSLAPVATLIVVILGFTFNNVRLNDLRDLLRAEMAKNQSEILARFTELEARIMRLEQQRLVH